MLAWLSALIVLAAAIYAALYFGLRRWFPPDRQ
jgi:hypothetical protein